jgi:hypothetical protein
VVGAYQLASDAQSSPADRLGIEPQTLPHPVSIHPTRNAVGDPCTSYSFLGESSKV